MNNNIGTLIAVIILIIAGIGGWFYYQNSSVPNNTPSNQNGGATGGTVDVSAPVPYSGLTSPLKEFTVTADNSSFNPPTITVSKGDVVAITVKVTAGTHDFNIDEYDRHTGKLEVGGENVVKFLADKSGSFEYYSSVGSDKSKRLKGMLTVQ
jgi:plastocyanin